MPTRAEKHAKGYVETTGHEWDGIQELNNPLPRWWLYILYATIAISVLYYVLYPAIPGITGHTKGTLGYDARLVVEERIAAARAAQRQYLDRIAVAEVDEIRGDAELLNFALAGGGSAFADNCAPCHGAGATGGPGYPSLADDAWLWGGTTEAIHETLLYGVRWEANEDTRFSEMPAFGADELLTREEIAATTTYVLSLSGAEDGGDTMQLAVGSNIYAENCVACHGEQGEGIQELGAPRLNDQVWLYGGTREEIETQLHRARHGVMPAWVGRLDDNTIKMLTVYVHSLGGGE